MPRHLSDKQLAEIKERVEKLQDSFVNWRNVPSGEATDIARRDLIFNSASLMGYLQGLFGWGIQL